MENMYKKSGHDVTAGVHPEKVKNELSRARAETRPAVCFPFRSTRLNWLLLDVVPANVRRRLAEETGATRKKISNIEDTLNDEIRSGIAVCI